MKRVLNGVKRTGGSRSFKKIAAVLLIFGLGVGTGSLITSATQKESSPVQSRSSSQVVSSEQRNENTLERLEEAYDRAKERIARDIESKRITEEQAGKITTKLDEMYNYRKSNPDISTEEKRNELQAKRRELRSWIEENNLSSRYFVGVL